MSTTTAPRPVIDALTVLQVLNFIRREKAPPLARYSTLLTLHEAGIPMTAHQIARRMNCDGPQSGTIDSCQRHDLVTTAPGPTASRHFILTPTGKEEVHRLLTAPMESLSV